MLLDRFLVVCWGLVLDRPCWPDGILLLVRGCCCWIVSWWCLCWGLVLDRPWPVRVLVLLLSLDCLLVVCWGLVLDRPWPAGGVLLLLGIAVICWWWAAVRLLAMLLFAPGG
jgi:hypothetical protein